MSVCEFFFPLRHVWPHVPFVGGGVVVVSLQLCAREFPLSRFSFIGYKLYPVDVCNNENKKTTTHKRLITSTR